MKIFDFLLQLSQDFQKTWPLTLRSRSPRYKLVQDLSWQQYPISLLQLRGKNPNIIHLFSSAHLRPGHGGKRFSSSLASKPSKSKCGASLQPQTTSYDHFHQNHLSCGSTVSLGSLHTSLLELRNCTAILSKTPHTALVLCSKPAPMKLEEERSEQHTLKNTSLKPGCWQRWF